MPSNLVPSGGWIMEARSIAPLARDTGMLFIVPPGVTGAIAIGPAGMDGQTPDKFLLPAVFTPYADQSPLYPDVLYIGLNAGWQVGYNGLAAYPQVGGKDMQLNLLMSIQSVANGIRVTQLNYDTVAGDLYPLDVLGSSNQKPLLALDNCLDPAVDYYVYVWVAQADYQIYTTTPNLSTALLNPTLFPTAAVSSISDVQAAPKLGTTYYAQAAVNELSFAAIVTPLQASIQSTTTALVVNPADFRLRLQPVSGAAADYAAGAVQAVIPLLQSSMTISAVPPILAYTAAFTFQTLPVQSNGVWVFSGQNIRFDETLPAVAGHIGDFQFGGVDATLPLMQAYIWDHGNLQYQPDYVQVRDTWLFEQLQLMPLSDTVTVQDSYTYVFHSDTLVPASSITASDSSTYKAQLRSTSRSDGAVVDNWSFQKVGDPVVQSGVTWAINLDTMASSQYTDYGFNSFFKYNGQDYGVADDGIYLLSGGSDNGTYINSILDTGTQDFNIARNKYLPKIYLGYQSTARGLVDVIADGVKRTYETRSMANSLDVRRVDCGVGVRANYWGVTLRNYQGADFAVDSVRLTPILTLRRM